VAYFILDSYALLAFDVNEFDALKNEAGFKVKYL
jgi:hypothetical protein